VIPLDESVLQGLGLLLEDQGVLLDPVLSQ
jgi:hypothetical protein